MAVTKEIYKAVLQSLNTIEHTTQFIREARLEGFVYNAGDYAHGMHQYIDEMRQELNKIEDSIHEVGLNEGAI